MIPKKIMKDDIEGLCSCQNHCVHPTLTDKGEIYFFCNQCLREYKINWKDAKWTAEEFNGRWNDEEREIYRRLV